MPEKNKKFYLTTSIPYTNAAPHLGFALEAIQTDVLARYHRILNDDTFFLTGTDEHGIKTLRAAREVNKEAKEFADEISEKFKLLAKALNISNNDFIRTTDEKIHRPAVEKVWEKLKESGDIYKKKYKGFYCAGCEAFITEKDLIDGKCPIHQKELELVEEENYFFRLSKYTKKIEGLIKKDKLKIIPGTRKNETLAMLKGGIEDISFSRRKDRYWGFPVPGDLSQIIYVWPDALTSYISAIGYPNGGKYKKYWPADVHCIGKDIMKFHTVFWPAMLLSLRIDLPKVIFVHGFITANGQKMSKSLGNVINPFDLVDKYGVDAVRYYLLREISPTEDGDFSYEKFNERYNSDLVSGIGNLVSRVITMAETISDEGKIILELKNCRKVLTEIEKTEKSCKKYLEDFKFNESLKEIWDLVSFCDKFCDVEKPWEKKKNAVPAIHCLLYTLVNLARLLNPFLPQTSEKILSQLNPLPSDGKPKKLQIKKETALFPRI